MCTQCTLQLPETNTFYMQCILGVIIIIWLKKMTNMKLFYFLSPNVLLLFVFKIDSWNVLFFLRNSVLCIWLSNEGTKHQFHLSLNYWKCNFFDNIVTPLASFTVGFLAENTEQNLNFGAGLQLLIIIILIHSGSHRMHHTCTCFWRVFNFCAPTDRDQESDRF